MSAARAWLALLAEPDPSASMAARVRDPVTGESVGWLSAWLQARKPVRHALRADPGAFDARGPAARASHVLLPAARAVIFDDPAVQRARQLVLAAGGPWSAVSTLVSDAVHFRGSLLAVTDPALATAAWDDPFELLAPGRRLDVEPGLISPGPLRLPAPVIERYAGRPWPQSGFS